MREIKFRVWDSNTKKWVNPRVSLWPSNSSDNYKEMYLNAEDDEGMPSHGLFLSQYTGLKDRNGKEIYEGDVVGVGGVYHFIDRSDWKPSSGLWKIIGEKKKDFTGKGEERYVAGYELKLVEWRDVSCGFEPFSDSQDNCGHCGGGMNPERFEVIGNIYENPELLKQ